MTLSRSMKITLTAEGGLPGVWAFDAPAAVTVGRGEKADLRPILNDEAKSLSRRHAAIELTPEGAAIRDLGSLNGTWLNGRLVGRREEAASPLQGEPPAGPAQRLHDGDIITMGRFTLRVGLVQGRKKKPLGAKCPGCGLAIPSDKEELCPACRKSPVAALKMLRAALGRGAKNLSALKGLRIEKSLGRGATAAVFLAVRKADGEKMALKVMPPAVSDNEWARKSFLREASLGQSLSHPNVARLYEFGSCGGTYYVLMEYCAGGSLEEFRKEKGGRLGAGEALGLIMPVLDGLIYMHGVRPGGAGREGGRESRLVHRDLKPANIFLGGPDGAIPKIADIGVAKFQGGGDSGHTHTGARAGSPATMPRQQAMNFKHAAQEVDVWAAAATVYKLVTGEYPRAFPPDRDPWQVVMEERARPLAGLRPDFPPHLGAALDEALIDDPAIIHGSAQSLKEALLKAAKADGLEISPATSCIREKQ
jgi:hypothetical protein